MRWEPERVMNNQPMNTLEAGISRLQPWRVSIMLMSEVSDAGKE
jgi:hypothetical protein